MKWNMREYGKVSGKKYVIETTWRERKNGTGVRNEIFISPLNNMCKKDCSFHQQTRKYVTGCGRRRVVTVVIK